VAGVDVHLVWRVDDVVVTTVVHQVLLPYQHFFAVDLLDLTLLLGVAQTDLHVLHRRSFDLLRLVEPLLLVSFDTHRLLT